MNTIAVDAMGGDSAPVEIVKGAIKAKENGVNVVLCGDDLVDLARKAKNAGQIELANQILNSAKFAKKTEFKKVEKDAGIGEEGE